MLDWFSFSLFRFEFKFFLCFFDKSIANSKIVHDMNNIEILIQGVCFDSFDVLLIFPDDIFKKSVLQFQIDQHVDKSWHVYGHAKDTFP